MPAPAIEIGVSMSGDGSERGSAPKVMVTNASSIRPIAIVDSIQPTDDGPWLSGRTAMRSMSNPNPAEAAIASGIPMNRGMPAHISATDSTEPSIRVSPWAKFTARTADHMM